MISSLDHLNLRIRDFSTTVAWYQRVLGFVSVEEGVDGTQRWVILRAGDALLCLYEDSTADPQASPLDHIGLRVTDRAALEAVIAQEGLQLHYGGAYEYPHSTSFYLTDPSGNKLELACWDEDMVRFP